MGPSHWSLVERRELLRLVVGGCSIERACRVRGVPVPTARVWVGLAGVKLVLGNRGGTGLVLPVLEDRVGHGRRLFLADRAVIEVGLGLKMSQGEIARLIGASPSTVSREIRRTGLRYRSETLYSADVAE